MNIRILSADHVRAATDMHSAIACMREAFIQLSAGHARVPLRQPIEGEGGVTLVMPAFLSRTGDLGLKIVSVYHGNPSRGLPSVNAVVLVLDARTGAPLALMDGTYLTALRTGAASGLATGLLARPDADVLTIFGAGAQARTQLEGVRAVRPIRELRIVARSAASAEAFAREVDDIEVRVLSDPATAVRGASVICAATNSAVPVFDGNLVEPGCHINGVGSYSPSMQEVDAALVRRARIVVDSREAALAEAGDLIVPIQNGVIDEARIEAELGEIAAGLRPARRGPDEITFFKSVGIAVQDVALARQVLEGAKRIGGRLGGRG